MAGAGPTDALSCQEAHTDELGLLAARTSKLVGWKALLGKERVPVLRLHCTIAAPRHLQHAHTLGHL